jgi:uncharacterized repeat protein (TIGR03803 family)
MNSEKFSGTAIAVLLVVFAIFAPAPSARAQSKFKTLYAFSGGNDGSQPFSGVTVDAAGNLYGTTYAGGEYGNGTVFELAPTGTGGWTESVLYSFTGGADGGNPQPGDGPIFDSAGNLYGAAGSGGNICEFGGCGVIFELTPTTSGWTESVLHSFTGGSDGGAPFAGLIFDGSGNLYSTTWNGGSDNCGAGCGVVFKLAPAAGGGWTESVLHSFMDFGPEGSNSDASLVLDPAGNLYGVTWYGGTQGWGVVFKLAPNTDGGWTESVLHQFKGDTDGAHPRGHLVFDSAGNLYGTAANEYASGYGVVFELLPNEDGTWRKRNLHQFTGGKDGANPYVGLTIDSAGNLYGVANDGGAYGNGVVFELSQNSAGGWSYYVLHTFNDHYSGAYPRGNLALDGAGNIYGTTYGDGYSTFGSVFEIAR